MSEFGRELTDLVQDLAKDAAPPVDGTLSAVWPQVIELGLVGIGIAEDHGGSGGSLGDLLVVIRELARAGLTTPIVEATTAARAVGMPRPGLFDTIAVKEIVDFEHSAVTADLGVVPYGSSADRVVLVTDTAVLALASGDADVLPATDIAGQPTARIVARGASCTRAADVDGARIMERLAMARSASLLGSARGAYELTRDYLLERRQFGKPLLEIPSVAASLARMAVGINGTQTALGRAVAVANEPGSPPMRRFGAASAARVEAARMATLVAASTHQLHGAIGITEEYPLHRYTRALWAQRDADRAEREWSARIGATAVALDEDVLWDQLTG